MRQPSPIYLRLDRRPRGSWVPCPRDLTFPYLFVSCAAPCSASSRGLPRYFHQTEHLRVAAKQRELIKMMSSALQHEVAWTCNEKWLQRVYFLKDAPLDFLVHLALRLEALVFAPGEVLPCGPLYIVNRGLAIYAGKLLGTGKTWGEQVRAPSPHTECR